MATLLLIVIYIAYIGLGIPDSLLGAAWPAIYKEFGFPVSYASYITILISCGTVISSFFSASEIFLRDENPIRSRNIFNRGIRRMGD